MKRALAAGDRFVTPIAHAHYKGLDVRAFESKLAGSGVEVRLRDWYAP